MKLVRNSHLEILQLKAENESLRQENASLKEEKAKLDKLQARLRRWQGRRREERTSWNEHPSVKLLREILRLAEPDSLNFGLRAREHIRLIGTELALENLRQFETAALLMHAGNLFIPAPLLKKHRSEQPVTGEERDLLNQIPVMGSNLLMQIPQFEEAAQAVFYQSKNYDGSGLPRNNLSRNEIPLGGRLLRIAGEVVSLETKGMPSFKAVEKISKWPNLFDPALMQTAVRLLGAAAASPSPDGQAIELKDLHAGQTLLSDLETNDGTLVVPAGNKITRQNLEKIQNFAQISGIKEPIFVRAPAAV